MKNKITKSFSYNLGMGIVWFFFNVFWTTTVFYFLNWQISIWNLIISIILVIFYWFLTDKTGLFKYCWWLILLFGLTFWISKSVYDLSGDGQSYHQEAVIQIALGWNPLKEKIIPDVWDSTHAIWMNHFPRFSWIINGLFYRVFENLEMSKNLNLMLMSANLLVAWAYLKNKFKDKKKAILLTIAITLNPISISEINTFCVDTLSASLFSLLLWNILIFLEDKTNKNKINYSITIITAILFNVKVFNLAYVFVIFISVFIYLIFIKSKLWKECLITFVSGGILGVLVLGFNPYVTNTVKFGTLLYPFYLNQSVVYDKSFSPHIGVVGNISEYIMKANSPADFFEKKWWSNFWKSIFSKSSNTYFYSIDNKKLSSAVSSLKIPFWVSKNELEAFIDSDVRVGGFGVWFSGAMILVFLLMTRLVLKRKKSFGKLFLFSLTILVMCRFNPEAWWARYVPFLWFIPVMVIYKSFMEKDRFLNIGAWFLGLILLINSLLILIVIVPFQINQTKILDEQYRKMLNIFADNKIPITVDFVTTRSWRFRFFDKKIPFVESKMEVGVMENYFFKNLNNNDILLLVKSYYKDEERYEYNLKNDVSIDDLVKLANIFIKLEKVPLVRGTI